MEKSPTKSKFSEQHPLLFGLFLIVLAVALFMGAMAFFRSLGGKSKPLTGDKIGLCKIEGMITDAGEVTAFLRELRQDDSVKGVLLRIDSPGGAVAPSQELYAAVRELAAKKPVVVSMGTAAASGGYYAAAPATLIMANPGTLTASIGVRAEYVNVQGLMEKLGLKSDTLASGRLKAAGSPTQPLTPEQRAYLNSLIMDLHGQFVGHVAEGRKMPLDTVEKLADGRAMTGRQAQEAGLVDRLGGQEQALEALRDMVKLPDSTPLLEGPEKKIPLLPRLLGATLSALAQALLDTPGHAVGQDGLLLQYRQ